MKMLFGTILGFVCMLSVVHSAHAADLYAESLVSATSNVLTPSHALGAPDGVYADFRDGDASLTLDMGQDVAGDLTMSLSVYLIQYGARYLVTFYDASWAVLATSGDTIPIMTTTVTAENTSGVTYRYVKITSVDAEQWRLDAVTVAGAAADEEEVVTEDEEPAVESPSASYTVGTMLKVDSDAAVYILGNDGMRHAFPTEREFTSWGLSFADVVTVDATSLAAFDLGRNVTIRPGTYLVKLASNPKVFAVEPGGILRWISTEAVALQLYGMDWTARVVDVPDTFFANYTLGEDVDTAVHPDGTIVFRNAMRYYVADGSKGFLDDETLATLRLSEDFDVTGINSTIFNQYADSLASLLVDGTQWPY